MLRILSLTISIIFLAGGIILFVGYRASPDYNDSITFEVAYSPEVAWREILDIQNLPVRKSDVASITVLEEYGKLLAWQENLKNGGYRIYRMNERIENQKLVIELTDSSYGLTGVWTFEVWGNQSNTLITISEKSTLSDFKLRGYRVIFGRNHDLLVWVKYINVGLLKSLLITP